MEWFQARQGTVQRTFRWIAVATFVLAAAQPFLGGFGFFRSGSDVDYTGFHGILANTLFPLSLALVVLALVAEFHRRRAMVIWSLLLTASIVSQIGLGYSARNDGSLLAWHLPGGVLVFGLALIVMLLSYGMTFERKRP